MPNTSASRSWAVWYDGNQNCTWISRTWIGHWNALGATHRYVLCRDGLQPYQRVQPRDGCVNFIMLNPSDSGKTNPLHNDNTVAKCEKFARRWGYRKLIVTNLFAFIASNPQNLFNCQDPVGPRSNKHLIKVARHASLRVAAWGEKYGAYCDRSVWFRHACDQSGLDLKILDRTKYSQPAHPLYLPFQISLQPYPYPC